MADAPGNDAGVPVCVLCLLMVLYSKCDAVLTYLMGFFVVGIHVIREKNTFIHIQQPIETAAPRDIVLQTDN